MAARADNICTNNSSNASSGSLTDSGGAGGRYQNNENCSFLIQSGGGSITLSFSQFNYENSYDYVFVYDGTTSSAPLIGRFTGSSIPNDVIATSGSMLVVHRSDFSVQRSGFQATWLASNGGTGSNTLCTDNSSSDSTGTLYDSGGPSGNYSNREDCRFLIQPTGGGTITLNFSQFNLQNADQLRVYNGTSSSAPLIATLTGRSIPADVTANAGAMLVRFTSNAGGTRAGFAATWSTASSCSAESVADNFNSVSYSQNNGSQNWATSWLEIGESNGPNSGISRVNSSNCSSGNCLRIGQPNSPSSWANIGVQREVNLSTAASATLSFNYFTGRSSGAESVTLDISSDGGNSWATLQTYNITGTSFTATPQSFDISAYTSTNTRIRFLSSGTNARIGMYIDDLQISYQACPKPTPIAEWRFDEAVWNNAANQVQDNSANSYHANAVNGANTQLSSPALSGNPGTCGYGNFDGNNDHVLLPSSFPNLTGSFTISGWINARSLGNDQRIFADDQNNSGGFAFSLGDAGNGKLRFFSRSVSPVSVDTQNAVISQNSWVFVAAVHDATAKTRQIYVNGSAVALSTGGTSSTYSGTWGSDSGRASIGGEVNGAGSEASANWRFNGLIDEVRIYENALTAAEIQAIMAERHTCRAASTDHLSISHSGNAITCTPATITLEAHQPDHSNDTSYSQTVNLSTSTNRGDWSIINGNGTLNNGTSNDGVATYSFTGSDNGRVQLGLKNTAVETVNINASDGSISETSGNATASEDQDLNFAEAGFRFLADNTADSIDTQISGKNSNISPGSQTLELQAIRTSPDTGACEAALLNNNDIEMGFECLNPGTCSSQRVAINSTNISANSGGSANNYTPVSLDFGDASDSTATFTLNYPDAGQIRLHARYSIALGVSSPSNNYMSGSSNPFVVKPAGICVEATDVNANCAAGNATCSLFKKAGEMFNLRIKGVAWQTSGESHSNFCVGNSTTPNFQLNNISLTSNLIAPLPGTNTGLGVVSFNMGASDNGSHDISNQTIPEVGVFTITATMPSYLGETIAASNSTNIGRFYPDHFTLSGGSIIDACTTGNFSYLGQPFTALYTLTAKNTNGSTTTNYRSDFIRLDTSSSPTLGSLDFGAIDTSAAPPAPTSPILLSSRLAHSNTGFAWNNGTGTLTSSLTLARAGVGSSHIDGPFSAQIGVLPIDADGVTITDINLNTDNTANNDHALIGVSNQRYGRLVIDNAFGPEALPLGVPVRTEYWNYSAFITNTDDSASAIICPGSQFSAPQFKVVDGNTNDSLSPNNVNPLAFGPILSGESTLQLSAPNASGPLDIYLDLPAASTPFVVPDWLRFDFNGDGTDQSPAGRALFGQYRGNDRIIYWQEQFD